MATTTALVIQLAKSAIDALVLDRLQHPPPQVPGDFAGACPGGRYRLRWCRPALTFPDDAPDMIRMGIVIEGGVQLDSGRILTCDAFVTVTAAPDLTHDENGWYIRLSIAQIQPGTVHLDYAGHDLAAARALFGADLPDDALVAQMRGTLTERIIQFCEEFPDIPLTYVFPSQTVTTEAVAIQVRPESRGAALTITIAAPLPATAEETEPQTSADVPLMVTATQNAALMVTAAALTNAFAQRRATVMPYVTAAGTTITRLDAQCVDGALLLNGATAPSHTENATEHTDFHLRAELTFDAGAWRIAITPAMLDANESATPLSDASAQLAQDAALQDTLATHLSQALDAALAPALGLTNGALTWQWHMARAATTNTVSFTPSAIRVSATGLMLSGALPLEPDESDLPDDGPSFDLEVFMGLADPLASATAEPAIIVRAVHQHGVTAPSDYAWQSSLATPLAEAHAALLELRTSLAPVEANTTPQRTQKLPRGIVEVTATLIDGFGRIGQAVIEIDLAARASGGFTTRETARVGAALVATNADRVATNPTAAVNGAVPAATRQTRATSSVTAHSTSYRAALDAPKNKTSWNILASILALMALIFAFGAYQLLHPAPQVGAVPHKPTPNITATIALTPQITAAPMATTATGTQTPAPTSPPEAFGRFDSATTTLQFACAGGNTTPQIVTIDDNGTAPLDWTAHVIDTIAANVPWATVTPTSGMLTTQVGNVATITVTPATGFCAATVPTSFRIQLTAPNAVPLTIVATHTVAATATTTPPTPATTTPTPTPGS